MNVIEIPLDKLTVNNPFVSEFWADVKAYNNWISNSYLVNDGKNEYEILVLSKKIFLNYYFSYIPFSPIAINQEHLISEKQLKEILIKIKKLNNKKIVFYKIDLPFEYNEVNDFSSLFIINKESIQPEETVTINLTKTLDEIRINYRKRAKRNLKKNADIIKVKNVDITKENFEIWYDIYKETAKRDNFTPRSFGYINNILNIKKDVKVKLLFAYKETEVVGGIIIIYCKELAIYLLGASKKIEGYSPSYSIQDYAIEFLKEQKVKTYDLYGIGDNEKSSHLQSLTLFKTSFSDNVLKRVPTLDLPINKFIYYLYKIAEKIRNFIYR